MLKVIWMCLQLLIVMMFLNAVFWVLAILASHYFGMVGYFCLTLGILLVGMLLMMRGK